MKKLSFTMVAALAMFFSAQTANAQVTEQEATNAVEETAQTQEVWTQITAEELPAEVQAAIKKDLAGITISESYVAEKDGAKVYKLVVTTANGQTKDLYADAQGNWIQKK